MKVKVEDLRVGDKITGSYGVLGERLTPWNESYVVVEKGQYDIKFFHYSYSRVTFEVERLGGGRTVKDWPISCPRCRRDDSAVMLFQTVECRHGCYK